MSKSAKFCSCVKSVSKTVKLRKGSKRGTRPKEGAAIAICVSKMLQSRGRTLKRFSCKKGGPRLVTQPLKNRR